MPASRAMTTIAARRSRRDRYVQQGAPDALARRGSARRAGLSLLQEKRVLALSIADAPYAVRQDPLEATGLELRRVSLEAVRGTFAATLPGSWDRLLARDRTRPTQMLAGLARRGRRDGLWHEARLGSAIAGILLPVVEPSDPTVGYLNYVGLVPRARGRRLGELLTRAAIRLLAGHGVEVVIGVVDTANVPMARILRTLGFRTVGRQEVWGPPDGT